MSNHAYIVKEKEKENKKETVVTSERARMCKEVVEKYAKKK